MCGRYQLYMSKDDLAREYMAHAENIGELQSNYNVAPKQEMPVVYRGRSTDRRFRPMLWGLVPRFYDNPDQGPTPINARSETVDEKPMFRKSFETRRCLVPTNGFYEWKKTGSGKQPYRVKLSTREIMTLAGIYTVREESGGEELWSYTILTTTPGEKVSTLHNRMPVILHPDHYGDWLNPDYGDYEELKKLCRPYPDEEIDIYPVPKKVGNVRNNGPELIERTENPGNGREGEQQQLF